MAIIRKPPAGGVAGRVAAATGYTVKPAEYAKLVTDHITMTHNGQPVVGGTVLTYGDVLHAVADSGWIITELYFYGFDASGAPLTTSFTISSDGKTADHVFNKPPRLEDFGYRSLHSASDQKTETKGSNYVYKMTQDKLDELNTKRFVRLNPGTSGEAVYDYGQFILGLIELPFEIDSSLVLEEESIRLADYDTKVMANVVSTDKISLDLGKVRVVGSYGNLRDYENTTAILHLPFADSVNVDLEYVIDKEIGIQYVIDAYSGKADINITSSAIGEPGNVIVSKTVDMGIDIPYTTLIGGKSAENTGIEVGGDNTVRTPYIEIVRNEAVLPDGFWTIPVPAEGVIGDEKGFIKVDNVRLETKALKSEKEMIERWLSDGVIIV